MEESRAFDIVSIDEFPQVFKNDEGKKEEEKRRQDYYH